jgi:hypothetical protein
MKGTMDHRSTARAVHSRAPRLLLALALGATMVLAGPAATARKDTEVAKESCKATSDVKLKAEPDGTGVIKVIGVVFSADDDVWDWRLKRNDEVSAKGSVKAKDADRSFRIVRSMVDPPGTDNIGFRAQNTATGEVCSIVVPY